MEQPIAFFVSVRAVLCVMRDVLSHQVETPLHAMVGGGDQINPGCNNHVCLQFVLWMNVLSLQAKAPLHAVLGGRDQIYHGCNLQQQSCLSGLQFVLWRDVLSQHAKAPLHATVGGGDQIYNDEVFSGKHVQEWLHTGRKVSTNRH